MDSRRGKAMLAAVSACCLLGWAGTSQAGVVFQSNFDSDPSNWNCSAPRDAAHWLHEWDIGWSSGCEGPETFNGQTHYSYEVSSGGTTGNSMKVWTHDSFPNDRTYSWMLHQLSAGYRELYTRWSMKIPPDMGTTGDCYYQKLWRYGFGPAGPNGGTEIYFNANYGAFPNSSWMLLPSVIPTQNNEVFPNGVLADGQWHSYEFRLKLNSSGRSDGIMEGWIDGVKVSSRSDRNYDATDASTFTFTSLGFGNRAEGSLCTPFQSAWRAIEFDDYVVSTTYIGPVGPQTPVNGACGPANGQSFTSAPTTNLCSSGTASALSGSGPWTWTCAGTSGGSTASCAASKLPTQVNGACGSANGQSLSSAPTTNLCSSGAASAVSGSGPWTWTCAGSNGGTTASCAASLATQPTTFFFEGYEDTSFASRGWYDTTASSGAVTTAQHNSGTRAFECRFAPGAQGCSSGTPGRHLFPASDTVYLSYWIKLSSSWVGSQRNYHPHLIYFLTNENGVYDGPAFTRLTAYSELNANKPRVGLQDGQNVDMSKLNVDLCNVTENRALNGCNGTCDADPWDGGATCYSSGAGTYWNGKTYTPNTSLTLNAWHHIELYMKMNSVSGGKGQKDGLMQMWVDGSQVMSFTDLIYRTNQHPTMQWNQFLLGPYIGDGSPVDQSLWIDDLSVAAQPPAAKRPSAPRNLRVQ